MSVRQITPLRVRRSLFLLKIALLAAMLLTNISTNAFAAGSISGRVTRASDGAGLAGTVIQFYDLNASDDAQPPAATTDATGNYSMNLPAGSYGVLTQNVLGYINKIYSNISCSASCDTDTLTPVVVANSAVTSIDFVLSPGGRITGRVTRASDGAGIANVLIYIVNSLPGGNFPFTYAHTDVNGNYTSDAGTDTGNVYVGTINFLGYRDEAYTNGAGNPYCSNCDIEATGGLVPVTLASGASNINFILDAGGQISGTVTNAVGGAPLMNVDVAFLDSTGNTLADALTDAVGHYASPGLPAGNYYVQTRQSGLADVVYPNALCAGGLCNVTTIGAGATTVAVTIGANTSGINFALAPGATITGTVTNTVGGAPIGNIFVGFTSSQFVFVGGARTNDNGGFSAILPPGTYFASTFDDNAIFGNQVYNGLPCLTSGCNLQSGTSIIVNSAGLTIPNINFALTAGTGSISGTVANAATVTALQGIQVQLLSITGSVINSQTTPAGGNYQFTGVPVGSYYVRANSSSGFVGQVYNGAPCLGNCPVVGVGTPVAVTAGGSAAGINFLLNAGKFITGTVSNSTGTLLVGIPAQLFSSTGVLLGTFNTNASGLYGTSALPPGTYYIRTAVPAAQNFVDELYNDRPCIPACVVTSGDPVAVTAANGNSGISFTLAAGGSISGTVTNNGAPVLAMPILVADATGVVVKNTTTDTSGNYTVAGLPTGSYFVRTSPNAVFENYVTQVYNGAPFAGDITAGTPVDVTVGATHAGVNFAAVSGGTVSGSVKATGTNAPIPGVQVLVYASTGKFIKNGATDWQGNYSVTGLAAGNYYLSTSAPGSTLPLYIDELYDNLPCLGCVTLGSPGLPTGAVTTGTPVAITNGATHSGVNFVLDSGAGGITGLVSNAATGAALPNVQVSIYRADGALVKSVMTAVNNGVYTVRGLPPGTYYARTFVGAATPNFADEAYNNFPCAQCSITTTTPITVTASATPTLVDFALARRTPGDVSGDGRTDVGIFRPASGVWYVRDSTTAGLISFAWGQAGDVPVAGDFDGDGRTDIAVFRPAAGVWFVRNSSTGLLTIFPWGQAGDTPVTGDYDGDGKTDVAIFRAATGTWYVRNSSSGTLSAFSWGQNGDLPVPGDYDGDGKADVAIFRAATGTWYVRNSSTGTLSAFSWGQVGDTPVMGDYDGDGKADVAIFRAATGTWYVRNSSTGTLSAFSWGQAGDTPVAGDYDGDAKADIAIFRAATGTWYIRNSSTGTLSAVSWGQAGDVAILQRP